LIDKSYLQVRVLGSELPLRCTMKAWVVALLCVQLVRLTAGQCSPSPCGINTNCETNAGGAAICRCQAGWDHAPGSNTIEGCPNRLSQSPAPRGSSQSRVVNNRLGGVSAISIQRQESPRPVQTDPCVPSPCGSQAQCRSTGNRAVCSCPAGYEGDPYTGCQADPCSQSPCGANAVCERNGEITWTPDRTGILF